VIFYFYLIFGAAIAALLFSSLTLIFLLNKTANSNKNETLK